MNIYENFYCSRCLAKINDDEICHKCGHNPSQPAPKNALKEGTLLNSMNFQIGAVRKKLKYGFIYGAYDYIRQMPVYIFEFFPQTASRNIDDVTINENNTIEFQECRKKLIHNLNHHHKCFEANNTIYIYRKNE